MEKVYSLEGKNYIQRPLVLGQFWALLPLLEGIKIEENMSALEVIKALGGKLSEALAIVLIEEGLAVREAMKDLGKRATEIECRLPIEMIPEVIEDFFECNRASSLIVRLTEALGKMRQGVAGIPPKPSSKFSGDSPQETPPEGTKSSGE